jgi:dTDP-4-amino-4,6-dideoxygalactose transaminase
MSKDERNCKFKNLYFTLPNSLAFLVSKELEKIKLYSHHRRLISDFYSSNINNPAIEILYKTLKNEKNNAFRFPILIKTEKLKNKLYSYMKQNNILL